MVAITKPAIANVLGDINKTFLELFYGYVPKTEVSNAG